MSAIYREEILFVHPDENLIITSEQKKPNTKLPPFFLGGRGGYMNGKKGYPLVDTLIELSQQEQWFFKLIRENIDYKTNVAIVRNNGLTKSEKNRKNKAFLALKARDLVKRIKRETYMVNPDALMYGPNYESNLDVWLKIQ